MILILLISCFVFKRLRYAYKYVVSSSNYLLKKYKGLNYIYFNKVELIIYCIF
jgi:hypothetical protein